MTRALQCKDESDHGRANSRSFRSHQPRPPAASHTVTRMRIGVDIQCAMNRAGTGLQNHLGFLIPELCRLLDEPMQLFFWRTPKLGRADVAWARTAFGVPKVKMVSPPRRLYRVWQQVSAWNRADLLWHNLYSLFPPSTRGRNAFVVPDIIPLMVDYGIPHFRDSHLSYYEKAVRHGNVILVWSEHTKQDVIKHLGASERKVRVAPLAAGPQYKKIAGRNAVREALGPLGLADQPYVLCVSTLEPRKNHAVLIRAYARLLSRDRSLPHRLVLVGAKWTGYEPIFELVGQLGLTDRVRYLGYAEPLEMIYNGADVMVFPSLYEGFGLPPLEAMACGVPVIAANATSLPEVVGDCGLLFDPNDDSQLADQLEYLLSDQKSRTEWAEKGLTRAATFSWKRTAELYLAAFQGTGSLS